MLIQMAKKFKEAVNRGDDLGLNNDELAFYDALANNEESVGELGDETLKKITNELAESLRKSTCVDWSVRESVGASLRLMVKRYYANTNTRLKSRKSRYKWDLNRQRVCEGLWQRFDRFAK
jgi:type I site-specific restriction-modification system R (restriction) subunit